MKLKSKIISSSLFASGMLVASLLYPIIPCKKLPNVPNPSGALSLCTLNPDTAHSLDSVIQYFGYTTQLTTAYFVVLLSAFLISMVFFHIITLKHK